MSERAREVKSLLYCGGVLAFVWAAIFFLSVLFTFEGILLAVGLFTLGGFLVCLASDSGVNQWIVRRFRSRASSSEIRRVISRERGTPAVSTVKFEEFISDGRGEPCMVCRHPIAEGSLMLVCPHCHGQAHKDHLLDWLEMKTICPMCRRKLR